MAVSLEIKGKCVLKSGSSVWGQTAHDDQITFEEVIGNFEVFTSESGPHVPAKVVHTGRYGILRVPLTDRDDALIDAAILAAGGTNNGDLGTLGADTTLFALQLLPAISGARQYTFPKCFLIDTAVITGWGVTPEVKRLLVFKAIPDPAALSTPTTDLFTFSAVV